MSNGLARCSIVVLFGAWLLGIPVSNAFAQSTREAWLALRQQKQDERAQAVALGGAPTHDNALTVQGLQFFNDSSGNVVVVGEARNHSASGILSFARVELDFHDADGVFLGSEVAYVHGGHTRRVIASGCWQDLAWQHQGDGRLAVWTMRGATLVSADSMSPGRLFNLDWKIRGVGDINGDDWPDLIWQHRVTGDIAAWLLNGRTMMAGVPIARVADTNWHIVGPR